MMEAWDVVIIGQGHAAMRSAISAKKEGASVLMLSYTGPNNPTGGTFSGIAATISEASTKDHRSDTIRSGDFLSDQNVVNNRTSLAVEHIAQLEQMGVNFRRDSNGMPLLRLLPGHSKPRVTDCGDSTSRELYQVLSDQCDKLGILRRGDSHVLKLVHSDNSINGLISLDLASGIVSPIQAKSIIISDGSFEGAWNGNNSGGWGMYLAQTAGASLRDMEFQNWTPFGISDVDVDLPENILGEGAKLQGPESVTGLPFEVALQMGNLDGWSVDMANINQKYRDWFAGVNKLVSIRLGLDATSEPIPVEARVNSVIGGIAVDENGRALSGGWNDVVPGLFACGPASCSGFHGGGQAVGNDLLEEIVGGSLAGNSAALFSSTNSFTGTKNLLDAADISDGSLNADLDNSNPGNRSSSIRSMLSQIMSKNMGLNRDSSGLNKTLKSLESLIIDAENLSLDHNNSLLMNTNLVENQLLQGMLSLSKDSVFAAINREESRGTHRRSDFEGRDDSNYLKHSLVSSLGEVSWMDLKKSAGGNWILAPGE